VTVADDVALAGNVRIGPNVTVGGSTAIGEQRDDRGGSGRRERGDLPLTP